MSNAQKCNVKNLGQEHDAQPKTPISMPLESELHNAFFDTVPSKCNAILKRRKYVRPLETECASRQEC
jgi:hypothetical protein